MSQFNRCCFCRQILRDTFFCSNCSECLCSWRCFVSHAQEHHQHGSGRRRAEGFAVSAGDSATSLFSLRGFRYYLLMRFWTNDSEWASAARSTSRSTGLTRWALNPASRQRRRSSSCP